MYRYKTFDGKTLEAGSLRGIAEALRRGKFTPEDTPEAWMAGSAKRAEMWNGSVIRTSSPEDHVWDLIDAGLLKPLE
jgi:hypothetical protein